MTNRDAQLRIEGWLSALLKDGREPLVLYRGAERLPVRVVPVRASGPARPDGLRDDAPASPGFSFAVAEAAIEVDARALDATTLAAVHELLSRMGYDDWMTYSHHGTLDAAAIAADPLLGLTFSSAGNGAGVLALALEAIGVSPADVAPAPR